MTKTDFINRRTEIISKMLDHPNEHGIYPTTSCFAELDDLFDELSHVKEGPSGAQKIRAIGEKEMTEVHECLKCGKEWECNYCLVDLAIKLVCSDCSDELEQAK